MARVTGEAALAYPQAPDVPMSAFTRLRAIQEFHTGPGRIRDAGGPVAMVRFGRSGLLPRFAVVTSPQGAHDVLAGTDDAIDKEMIVHVEQRKLGDNVFNLANSPWTARRRTLQPIFTKRHVSRYAGHMADAAELAAQAWVSAGTADLDEEMRQLTLRVVGRSVFGLDLGDRAQELGAPVRTVLRWVTNRSVRPVRAPDWLPTPARRRVRRARATLYDVIDAAIEHARTSPDQDAELIRLLLQARDPETGAALSHEAVRDELLIFVLAGHDTTATTLAYSLWALGRHPDIQDKVAAEVLALGDRPLAVEDVASLPYTVQVLHEALRICPPAPAVGRMAMRDVVIDGFRVPQGTNIMVGAYALHHDPALWDEPEKFDPDRFGADQPDRHRWQYLPFGGGPRSCIGDHFAMLEATLALATIVRAVEIESLNEDFPVDLPFTMTAGGPIPARIRARQR